MQYCQQIYNKRALQTVQVEQGLHRQSADFRFDQVFVRPQYRHSWSCEGDKNGLLMLWQTAARFGCGYPAFEACIATSRAKGLCS